MCSRAELTDELSSHLINSGLTYNAEVKSQPIITRQTELDTLVSSVVDYLEKAGYVKL